MKSIDVHNSILWWPKRNSVYGMSPALLPWLQGLLLIIKFMWKHKISTVLYITFIYFKCKLQKPANNQQIK